MKTNEPNFLDRLRQKPDSYRRNFTLLVSAAITLVIIGGWAMSLANSFSAVGTSDKLSASTSFFSLGFIKDQIVEIFNKPTPSLGTPSSYATSSSGMQAGEGTQGGVQ